MNIGFCNIYSWRPHVEHLYYLSKLMSDGGHAAHFLTCDSGVSTCYSRKLKNSGRIVECSKCIAGGIRSYPVKSVSTIKRHRAGPRLAREDLERLALSSSSTLLRTEADHELYEPDAEAIREEFKEPVLAAYQSALEWIARKKLDSVVCFNGRMELTQAVSKACEDAGIPFVTHERSWFGHGIQLVPNASCISVKAMNEMSIEFRERPLLADQAQLAAQIAAQRFLQRNRLEWRLYNEKPEAVRWPSLSTDKRILILPSSRNEFAGDAEWQSGWQDNTEALDDYLAAFGIHPEQVVLRGHPNWSENIAAVGGARASSLYRNWAASRGIHFIESSNKASTYDLIEQADVVVLNGGTSALEAGVCGKEVHCLGPSNYTEAGFVRTFRTPECLNDPALREPYESDVVVRKALRFIFLAAQRFPQYVLYVRADQTTSYRYYDGADPERLSRIISSGSLEADDPRSGQNDSEEEDVLALIGCKQWPVLAAYQADLPHGKRVLIRRKPAFLWLDGVRSLLPRGDVR